MSKLRECTHRVIPICGAVLVTFSLGGGLGYAVNGKPLPRDAVVGVSIAFLVLGTLFGAGCLRLYICRRSRDIFDLEKNSPDPDRVDVRDSLERGRAAEEVSPPPPVHNRTVGRVEQGQGRRERAGNSEGFDMFGSYAEQESTIATNIPDRQRAATQRQGTPETPTPKPRPAPFSWERRSGLLDPTRRKTLRVQNAHPNPQQQSTQEGSEHAPSRDEAPRDGPSTNVPRRTQSVRRREPPHQRHNSAATIRAHNPHATSASEGDGRLMHDIVALTGMPKTQANLRDGGEPILPRSSSLKRTGSVKKTEPGNSWKVFGSKSTVSRSSSQRSHSQVSRTLGVGPYERRAQPSQSQPERTERRESKFQAWHPNMSNSSVNDHENPSVEGSSSKQDAERIAKSQRPGQDLSRSLTARRVDGRQEDNAETSQMGGWI